MSNPTEVITYSQPSTGHGEFRCSRRTAAHLDFTKKRLAQRFPDATLQIIQGCYHTGVGLSEGTHDRDCCLDVRILGLQWLDAQAFLRNCGWGAWWRRPSQGPWDDHIHMISLGFARYGLPVGKFVDGGLSQFGAKVTSSQVDDYYAHAWGLEGMHDPGSDPSWFPADIDATVFDFEAWEQELEANMPLNDADEKIVESITRRVIREELAAFAKTAGETIKVDNDGDPKTAKVSLERKLRS